MGVELVSMAKSTQLPKKLAIPSIKKGEVYCGTPAKASQKALAIHTSNCIKLF